VLLHGHGTLGLLSCGLGLSLLGRPSLLLCVPRLLLHGL
jgi:hypothetical protein